MANKFEKRTYTNRQSQYPGRRKFTPTGIENVYEVERQEGEITDPGTAFDADTLNDIEQRVYNGFNLLDDTDISITDTDNIFTGTKLNEVLRELFQYASNGKTAIANAIRGVSSSSTFAVLANAITSGKSSIATGLGQGSANDTFSTLASYATTLKNNYNSALSTITTQNSTISNLSNEITTGKTSIANAIGQTPDGTPTANSTFAQMASLISIYKKNYVSLSLPSAYKTISATNGQTNSYRVSVNFGFTPSMIYVERLGAIINGEIVVSSISKFARDVTNSTSFGIDNIDSSGFTIWIKAGSGESFFTVGYDTNMNVIAMG